MPAGHEVGSNALPVTDNAFCSEPAPASRACTCPRLPCGKPARLWNISKGLWKLTGKPIGRLGSWSCRQEPPEMPASPGKAVQTILPRPALRVWCNRARWWCPRSPIGWL